MPKDTSPELLLSGEFLKTCFNPPLFGRVEALDQETFRKLEEYLKDPSKRSLVVTEVKVGDEIKKKPLIMYPARNVKKQGELRFLVYTGILGAGAYGTVFDLGIVIKTKSDGTILSISPAHKVIKELNSSEDFDQNLADEKEHLDRLSREQSSKRGDSLDTGKTIVVQDGMIFRKHTGEPLDVYMGEQTLDPSEAWMIAYQLVSDLCRIHGSAESGYVHRDIKPSNVMLDGVGLLVKIIDFGSALKRTQSPQDPQIGTTLKYRQQRSFEKWRLSQHSPIQTWEDNIGLACCLCMIFYETDPASFPDPEWAKELGDMFRDVERKLPEEIKKQAESHPALAIIEALLKTPFKAEPCYDASSALQDIKFFMQNHLLNPALLTIINDLEGLINSILKENSEQPDRSQKKLRLELLYSLRDLLCIPKEVMIVQSLEVRREDLSKFLHAQDRLWEKFGFKKLIGGLTDLIRPVLNLIEQKIAVMKKGASAQAAFTTQEAIQSVFFASAAKAVPSLASDGFLIAQSS